MGVKNLTGVITLQISSAQGARTMPQQPFINARKVKHMVTLRQTSNRFADLEILSTLKSGFCKYRIIA